MRQKLPEGLILTERQQRLFEASGHLGPWTPDEIAAAGIITSYSTVVEDQKPPAVLKAEAAEDQARLAFDEANAAWIDMVKATRKVEWTPQIRIDKYNQPHEPSVREHQARLEEARTAEAAALEIRKEAAKNLVRAKGVLRSELRRWYRKKTGKAK